MMETQKAATAPTTAATQNAIVSAPDYTANAQSQHPHDALMERLFKQSKEIEDKRKKGTLNKPTPKVTIQNAAGLLAKPNSKSRTMLWTGFLRKGRQFSRADRSWAKAGSL